MGVLIFCQESGRRCDRKIDITVRCFCESTWNARVVFRGMFPQENRTYLVGGSVLELCGKVAAGGIHNFACNLIVSVFLGEAFNTHLCHGPDKTGDPL